jgi:formate dehydrogenase subunit gamma
LEFVFIRRNKMGHAKHPVEYIKRFSRYRIIEHQANAIAFGVLALTGLAQRFHDASWAQWVIMNLGGIDNSRLIHRSTGLVFAVLTISHILMACYGVIFKKWAPSMIINKKDFTDAIANLRYYFGMTDSPARCDRYDYKQKFEYWGVVVGGLLMIATGFTLWFPTVVFHLAPFLPGQIIPAAKAAHTNEAMLAFLVIIIWHIYNSVFSPEVFPLDTTIFTGKISKERMIHEHPLEYERLFGVKLEDRHGEREEEEVPETEEVVQKT